MLTGEVTTYRRRKMVVWISEDGASYVIVKQVAGVATREDVFSVVVEHQPEGFAPFRESYAYPTTINRDLLLRLGIRHVARLRYDTSEWV